MYPALTVLMILYYCIFKHIGNTTWGYFFFGHLEELAYVFHILNIVYEKANV